MFEQVVCLLRGCLSKLLEAVFEAGKSLTEKTEQERKNCGMYTFSRG